MTRKFTCLRLMIKVNDKFYYDIGLRRDNKNLSRTFTTMGEEHPRFLEDFIRVYGSKKIQIIDYGKIAFDEQSMKHIENIMK